MTVIYVTRSVICLKCDTLSMSVLAYSCNVIISVLASAGCRYEVDLYIYFLKSCWQYYYYISVRTQDSGVGFFFSNLQKK